MNFSKTTVTAAQMRKIDSITSTKYGISSLILMENAGKAAADSIAGDIVKNKNKANKKICIVCGSGNNAGDGFVSARYLLNYGFNVKIIMIKLQKSLKNDAKINFDICKKLKVPFSKDIKEILKAGYIVDAMLGTGINGEVSGKIKSAIEMINKAKGYKVSIDIPSGINADLAVLPKTAVKADKTITLELLKKSFTSRLIADFLGKIEIVHIGIPKKAIEDILCGKN
jgi:NAD(P)H-hydrate epimerase